jgi:hypothetical protein
MVKVVKIAGVCFAGYCQHHKRGILTRYTDNMGEKGHVLYVNIKAIDNMGEKGYVLYVNIKAIDNMGEKGYVLYVNIKAIVI